MIIRLNNYLLIWSRFYGLTLFQKRILESKNNWNKSTGIVWATFKMIKSTKNKFLLVYKKES